MKNLYTLFIFISFCVLSLISSLMALFFTPFYGYQPVTCAEFIRSARIPYPEDAACILCDSIDSHFETDGCTHVVIQMNGNLNESIRKWKNELQKEANIKLTKGPPVSHLGLTDDRYPETMKMANLPQVQHWSHAEYSSIGSRRPAISDVMFILLDAETGKIIIEMTSF